MIKTDRVDYVEVRTISEISKRKWIADEDCEDGGFYTNVMVPLKKPMLYVRCSISITCTENEKLEVGGIYGTNVGGAYKYTGESMVLASFNGEKFSVPECFVLISTQFHEGNASN